MIDDPANIIALPGQSRMPTGTPPSGRSRSGPAEPTTHKPLCNPWPVSIITFFAVAIAGLVAFIIFCGRHPADLVAENYYDQEVLYQAQIDRIQRARQSPVPAAIVYDPSIKTILIKVLSPDPSSPVTGKIHLYRPSSVNLDRELKLEPDAAGVQKVDARTFAPGLWQVRLSWSVREKEYYLDRKIVIGGDAE